MNTTSGTETATPTAERPEVAENYISPSVNIFETKDGYVLEADLPGVAKEGVDISVEENTLTITGRRQRTELKADELYRESRAEDYQRAFELDPNIDTSKIEAKMDDGVLTVALPKSERVKPRKINVGD